MGSTALMNLIASSPEASTLCKKGGHFACEGQDLLLEAGLVPDVEWKTLNAPKPPEDWNEAVDAYAKVWNTSKRVLVDKTPANVPKVHQIHQDLSRQGRKAKFLLVTRSPCDRRVHAQGQNEHS